MCLKLAQKVCASAVKYQNPTATDAKAIRKHTSKMHSSRRHTIGAAWLGWEL
jgi:hypothetical protein